MKVFVMVVALAVLIAVGMGAVSGMQPVAVRQAAHGVAVGPEWYAALPNDSAAATEALLARIPADARARGDAFGKTRNVTRKHARRRFRSGQLSTGQNHELRSPRGHRGARAHTGSAARIA